MCDLSTRPHSSGCKVKNHGASISNTHRSTCTRRSAGPLLLCACKEVLLHTVTCLCKVQHPLFHFCCSLTAGNKVDSHERPVASSDVLATKRLSTLYTMLLSSMSSGRALAGKAAPTGPAAVVPAVSATTRSAAAHTLWTSPALAASITSRLTSSSQHPATAVRASATAPRADTAPPHSPPTSPAAACPPSQYQSLSMLILLQECVRRAFGR